MTLRSTSFAGCNLIRLLRFAAFLDLANERRSCTDRQSFMLWTSSAAAREQPSRKRKHRLDAGTGGLEGRRDGRAGGGEDGVHFCLSEGQETLDDDGIELRAAALDEAADGFFMGEAFAVGAGRDHGIEGIDHCDDAGDDGYFGVFEAGGVAFAVEGFVVVENI